MKKIGIFIVALIFCLPSSADDWPQFLGPMRNGVSQEKGAVEGWTQDGPSMVWEKKLGEGFSGPVVANGKLIIFHRLDNQEVVECLDAASGKFIWKHESPAGYRDDFGFDAGPRSTPLIADGRVYTFGAEGELSCLALENGKKMWSRSVNADYRVRKGFFGVATSPILEGDLLLINVGGKEQKAGIVALHKDTGREVWKATDHEASYASPTVATVDGARHALFFTREGLVSLDPTNGKGRFQKRWRSRQNSTVNAATPLVVENEIFISSSYETGAFVAKIGPDRLEEIWSGDEILSNHYCTSVHHNGHLYGIDGRQEYGAQLRCVEWKTGKVLWSRERFGCASMIVADGKIIALTENGELVLFEATPTGYREKARAAVLEKPCRAVMALANGRLYARDGRRLVCWKL